MSGIVAVVGRPNVGKSTLFNRLTKTRQALVDDMPGVTRDRLYGRVYVDGREFTLVDTGGFDPPADQPFAAEVHSQIQLALDEADVVLFLADGRAGLNPQDHEVVQRLRRTAKPVLFAVNKIDSPQMTDAAAEFYALGVDHLSFISAAHGLGVGDLVDEIVALLPPDEDAVGDEEPPEIRVALIGRPNVGKSSLINRLVGGDRVVVSEVPGTTRDAVDTPLVVGGRRYLLIDTAGVRRPGRVGRGLERAMVFRSLRAIERAHVAAVVLDAAEGAADQDLRLVGQALDANRAVIAVLNKWDLVSGDPAAGERVRRSLSESLKFAPWAPILTTSAASGKGVGKLLPLVAQLYDEFNRRVSTGQLNKALEEITGHHPPPFIKGRRLKFYYASQVAVRPPTVVIMVNNPKGVHFSYQRYLNNELRSVLGLTMSPLRLIFRERSGRRPPRNSK